MKPVCDFCVTEHHIKDLPLSFFDTNRTYMLDAGTYVFVSGHGVVAKLGVMKCPR